MPRLRLQRTALGTRLRSLRERPLEQRHLRAALVLLAGLGLSALGFAAVGPSLGAFTATVSSQAEVGAGSLGLAVAAPNASAVCATSAAAFSVSCPTSLITASQAPGVATQAFWQAESSGTITPQNDPGFSLALGAGSCSPDPSTSTICSETEVTVDEEAASPNSVTELSSGFSLSQVTCAASSSVCVAVGSTTASPTGVALVSDDGGVVWSAPQDVDSTSVQTNGLSGVSCPSATECVAVGQDAAGSEGVVSVGTETTTASGSSWSWNPEAISNTYNLLGVSCPSTSFCMAVGQSTSGGSGIAVPLNVSGGSATDPSPIVGLGFPSSNVSYGAAVSCPSTSQCVALVFDSSYHAEAASVLTQSLTPNRIWMLVGFDDVPNSTVSPPTYVFGLVCPTTSECVGDGEANYGGSPQSYGIVTTLSYSSANATWSWGTAQEPSSGTVTPIGLVGIACPTASDCVAVGAASGGLVATTTTADGGTSWSTPDLFPSPMGFDSVACSTQQDCVAVTPYDSQTSGPASSATSTNSGQSWVGYQPLACVYGESGSNGTCAFSSNDNLTNLGNAKSLALQPSTVADPGVLVEVSTELASSSTSDESATATVPFTFTATA
jgi:hypothetical protein